MEVLRTPHCEDKICQFLWSEFNFLPSNELLVATKKCGETIKILKWVYEEQSSKCPQNI